MRDAYIYLISFGLAVIVIFTVCYYFWSYEPSVNPNNLLKTFYNATGYELTSRKIANFQINEITIEKGKPVYCGQTNTNFFNDRIGRCIELNMTNPISYVGKFTALQIDEFEPICHVFEVWENGSIKDIGLREEFRGYENHCSYRTVANLPNDGSLQLQESVKEMPEK